MTFFKTLKDIILNMLFHKKLIFSIPTDSSFKYTRKNIIDFLMSLDIQLKGLRDAYSQLHGYYKI